MFNRIKISLGLSMMLTLVAPPFSWADWSMAVGVEQRHYGGWEDRYEHHFYRWHDHPHYGYSVHFLPASYYTVWVDGTLYYYCDGLYYVREGFDYVVADPPIGAYVGSIPPDFQPVIIGGRTYYTDDGVYYIFTRYHGYEVVPAPPVYAQPAAVVVAPPAAAPVATQVIEPPAVANVPASSPETFPINIPNNSGGYTTVVIRRSGSGYVGPQGEYYAQFPTVAQLKSMYVK